jgi:signal transduction histidine kinase
MIFNSIRWRLQAWHGVILVTVLTGFGLTAYHVARDNQQRRIDQELDQRLMALFRPRPPGPPPEHPQGPPPGDRHGEHRFDSSDFVLRVRESMREAIQQAGTFEATQTNTFYYLLIQENGSVLARSPGAPDDIPAPTCSHLPEPTRSAPSGGMGKGPGIGKGPFPGPGSPMPSEARTREDLREVYRFLPHGECVLVGRSMAPDLAAMHRLALWLVAAGSSVLLLGLAGGWWLATRAIRPIEDISATALKIAGGDLSHRINIADTESELGRLAGVLNSTFARLEAAFAHQARFTADASHELRTPISVIVTQTQSALSRERAATEYREALEACQRAAKRMRSLTESLLQLARLDAGQEPMQRERFDLARVTQDSVELVRPLAAERAIEFQCNLALVECLGDAGRIGQVATNLLTNAIHFNREGGRVQVSVRTEEGVAWLTVTDTGVGIPPEDLPHIFERFYRVDKSRSRIQGQNGLGLAICKAIVDSHGGSISVSSQPGSGASFVVRLPRK